MQELETWTSEFEILEYFEVTEAYLKHWQRKRWLRCEYGVDGAMFHRKDIQRFEADHAEDVATAKHNCRHAEEVARVQRSQLLLEL